MRSCSLATMDLNNLCLTSQTAAPPSAVGMCAARPVNQTSKSSLELLGFVKGKTWRAHNWLWDTSSYLSHVSRRTNTTNNGEIKRSDPLDKWLLAGLSPSRWVVPSLSQPISE